MPQAQFGHSWAAEGLNEVGEDVRPPLTGESITEDQDFEYVIRTNLSMEYVNEIAAEVFAEWAAFAAGKTAANGQVLMHPTGKYASTLSMRQTGEASIAIVADPKIDIVAWLMETGHGSVDLKTKKSFQQGRVLHSAMWAYPSRRFPNGGPPFVTVGATGWVIPPMPAYSPARTFALLAARLAQDA